MKLRDESGQTIVFTMLALVGVLGMTALVLDVGSWFRAQRDAQATADASALAGAQWLPDGPSAASGAFTYAGKNGGGVAGANITITSTSSPADTITVQAARPATSFFAQVLGISSFTVHANAKATAELPAQAMYVAPMVVSKDHPLLAGAGCPCFGQATTLPFDPMGAPGAFGMLDLNNSGGAVGSSNEGAWIDTGFNKMLPLGNYDSDPGAKFSSQNVQGALSNRIGTVLLFPVFSTLGGQGSNAVYTIIGWVGFYLTGYTVQGNNATLSGHFTHYIAHGIQATTQSGSQPDFGVRTVQLVG
jgi:Flp pilus assembly protein TadG